jgi:hypothetical protein
LLSFDWLKQSLYTEGRKLKKVSMLKRFLLPLGLVAIFVALILKLELIISLGFTLTGHNYQEYTVPNLGDTQKNQSDLLSMLQVVLGVIAVVSVGAYVLIYEMVSKRLKVTEEKFMKNSF